MKIKRLKIEGYKNLELQLEHDSDLLAIIGANGSGKSNLLESLSYLFKSLYYEGAPVAFDYLIEYTNSKSETIRIEKTRSKTIFHRNDEPLVSIKEFLPKKIVAIYSGEEDRLWRGCFEPFYDDFIREINRLRSESNIYLQMPQMMYLNRLYWHISLLSLAISPLGDNQQFITNVLGIQQIDKIKFDFDRSGYRDYISSPTLQFIKAIDGKSEYTIQQLKEIFEAEGYIPDDVYRHLYLAFTPKGSKIIRNITIKFNQHLTIEDLSEGEKKLLLLKAAFEFAEQEDSLFILDEPDAHVHLNNKELIIRTFDPYKSNRQIVLTTHSPTVTQCMSDDELYMVTKGRIIPRRKQEIIGDLTDEFWNKHQQNIFLSSTKKMILLVEGKHDKLHIENAFAALRDEYSGLDFDIFSLGGESKIHPFMVGLYESGVKSDVTYVGIYDNDGAGSGTLNRAGFDPEVEECGYRKLRKDKTDHNNFFALAIPKPGDFTADCTIENLYSPEKYEKAYQAALQKTLGHFSNQSIDKINEDIKSASKNILADDSKSFEKEDFTHFRRLFDLIHKMKKDPSEYIESSGKKNSAGPKTDSRASASKTTAETGDANPTTETATVKKIAVGQDKEGDVIFHFQTKAFNAQARFNKDNDSMIVLAGSEIAKKSAPNLAKTRGARIESVKHRETDRTYVIESNVEFTSPSGASTFVSGRNSNGWKDWKSQSGLSLAAIHGPKKDR